MYIYIYIYVAANNMLRKCNVIWPPQKLQSGSAFVSMPGEAVSL